MTAATLAVRKVPSQRVDANALQHADQALAGVERMLVPFSLNKRP
jgi:hypothetical protein